MSRQLEAISHTNIDLKCIPHVAIALAVVLLDLAHVAVACWSLILDAARRRAICDQLRLRTQQRIERAVQHASPSRSPNVQMPVLWATADAARNRRPALKSQAPRRSPCGEQTAAVQHAVVWQVVGRSLADVLICAAGFGAPVVGAGAAASQKGHAGRAGELGRQANSRCRGMTAMRVSCHGGKEAHSSTKQHQAPGRRTSGSSPARGCWGRSGSLRGTSTSGRQAATLAQACIS